VITLNNNNNNNNAFITWSCEDRRQRDATRYYTMEHNRINAEQMWSQKQTTYAT